MTKDEFDDYFIAITLVILMFLTIIFVILETLIMQSYF